MENVDNMQKYIIYSNSKKVSQDTWSFLHKSDMKFHGFPEHDFYVPVFLTKTNEVFEYVQINKDDKIEKITRQEVNPFFMELSFFDGVSKNKALKGSDLTNDMIDYIRDSRVELLNSSNDEVVDWFDQVGVNEFPWNKGTNSEVNLSDIDRVSLTTNHIISKANYFNIDINK